MTTAREKMSEADKEAVLGRITTATSLAALSRCDLAIEAASENVNVKLKIFAELDSVLRPDAIIASNTSSISITRLAAGTKRPGQVIGMHFFNPVPVMGLIEVVGGLQTSAATSATVEALAKWVQSVKFTDRALAKQAVAHVVDTARQLELTTLDQARALDFDTAMDKSGIAFRGAKKVLETYGLSLDIDGLNPVTNQWNASNINVGKAIYDPMVVLDTEGVAQPYLVESFEPNDDFTEWTITTRDGIEWHNGDPLTPYDIATHLKNIQLGALSGSATWYARRASAPKNAPMFITFWPFHVTGAPVMTPCSFPKAMMLPVKVSDPRNTSKPSAPIVRRFGSPPASTSSCHFKNSATPTSDVARPPNACENAIRSGIFVIGKRALIAMPMVAPINRPATMKS